GGGGLGLGRALFGGRKLHPIVVVVAGTGGGQGDQEEKPRQPASMDRVERFFVVEVVHGRRSKPSLAALSTGTAAVDVKLTRTPRRFARPNERRNDQERRKRDHQSAGIDSPDVERAARDKR